MSRRGYVRNVLAVLAACLAASVAPAQDAQQDQLRALQAKMKELDKRFKLKLGGRVQSDWTWADAGDYAEADPRWGEEHDGHEFRRVWLYVGGTVYDDFEFKVQYDIASHNAARGANDIAMKDTYVGLRRNVIKHLPGIRVGHVKEPIILENMTSNKYLAFMERSLANALTPGRNAGVMVHNAHFGAKNRERLAYAVGVFRDVDNGGWGAWELAARYSHINLEDKDVRADARMGTLPAQMGNPYLHAGEQTNYSLGLNWYWNPNIKLMFNYVLAQVNREWRDNGVGVVRSYQGTSEMRYAMVRMQIDF